MSESEINAIELPFITDSGTTAILSTTADKFAFTAELNQAITTEVATKPPHSVSHPLPPNLSPQQIIEPVAAQNLVTKVEAVRPPLPSRKSGD